MACQKLVAMDTNLTRFPSAQLLEEHLYEAVWWEGSGTCCSTDGRRAGMPVEGRTGPFL